MRTKAQLILYQLEVSQQKITKEAGVNQAYVSRCLAGKQKPSKRLIEAVAKATGLPASLEIFK